jgi:hypothetical protein
LPRSRDFRKLGIPGEVWEPIVSRYEEAAVRDPNSDPIRKTQDQLVVELNRYRAEKQPSLPVFNTKGRCGSGEIEVHIALAPPDGQLFLIPVFLFKLCQAQHLNPSDTKACDRWIEVLNGTASWVSGDYMYMARWSDGSVRCGPLGFASIRKNGETFSITKMRSPECKTDW